MSETTKPPETLNRYGPEKIALVEGPSTGKSSWLAALPFRIKRMNGDTPPNLGYTLEWDIKGEKPLFEIGEAGPTLHSVTLSKEPRWKPDKPKIDPFGFLYAGILKKHNKEAFSVDLDIVDAPGTFIQNALMDGSTQAQKAYVSQLKHADKIIFFINYCDEVGNPDGKLFSKLKHIVDPAKIVICMVKTDVLEEALGMRPSSSSMITHYRVFCPDLSLEINPDIYKVYFATNWGKTFVDGPYSEPWVSRGILRPLFDHLDQKITSPNKLRPYPNDRFHKWDIDK